MQIASGRIQSFYYIGMSLAGLSLLTMLSIYSQIPTTDFPFRRQLVISVFILTCLLGIIAGASPSTCFNMLYIKKSRKPNSYNSNGSSRIQRKVDYVGHHPVCSSFSSHTMSFGKSVYCVGCTGLIIGATISIIGSLIYVLVDPNFGRASQLIFWTGFVWVWLGLIQHNISVLGGVLVHLLLNIVFVVGAFFLLVAIDVINGNFVLELYLFGLIFFWIFARTKLSQLEHGRICASCGLKDCSLA
jgi:hypothetical protein